MPIPATTFSLPRAAWVLKPTVEPAAAGNAAGRPLAPLIRQLLPEIGEYRRNYVDPAGAFTTQCERRSSPGVTLSMFSMKSARFRKSRQKA